MPPADTVVAQHVPLENTAAAQQHVNKVVGVALQHQDPAAHCMLYEGGASEQHMPPEQASAAQQVAC